MGGFRVGGVAKEVASFTAAKIDDAPHESTTPEPPPPPPVSDDETDRSAGDCICPAADVAHFENQAFADDIVANKGAARGARRDPLATRMDDRQ
ncbi:hypothetical protein CYMTET_12968 [Cymbomonas tetramitiformis]|uniref:Uncharacterized protein n=1 Tax=Cymbomonas tetramitiformis TaxID=36881 RepID=A0AAE0GJD0_9CHLO|nr:hypothetical protein CYMTET_12968 [Cymbomonas tetramitiformis]